MDRFSLNEISRLVGVEYTTLRDWVRAGLIRPIRRGTNGEKFDKIAILTAGMIRAYRRKRVSMQAIRPLATFLSSLTIASLEKSLAEGKTLLTASRDQSPRLVVPSPSIFEPAYYGKQVFCFGVGEAWRIVNQGIAQYQVAAPAVRLN